MRVTRSTRKVGVPAGAASAGVASHGREDWDAILARHDRVAIVGGPQVGKTTLAKSVVDRRVFHSDDFKQYEWAEVPHKMIETIDAYGCHGRTRTPSEVPCPFVVEGVMVARALRKGLKVDAVVVLHAPVVPRLKGQVVMAKGVMTVLNGIKLGVPRYDFWKPIPEPIPDVLLGAMG